MNALAFEFIPDSILSVWQKQCTVISLELPTRAAFLRQIEPSQVDIVASDSTETLNELPTSINDYTRYIDLISWEQMAQKEALANYTLYNVKPHRKRTDIWEFIFPGLADASSMINEGDWVIYLYS